jgi:two-component system chemotaxis sensor kinase CheA
MSLDLSGLQQAFFEECAEHLDGMEAALLAVAPDGDHSEAVHTVFRGAHSIKGGAAMFGFEEIAAFTHAFETRLGQVRDTNGRFDTTEVNLFLRCVDAVRAMLAARREGRPYDRALVAALEAQLKGAAGAPQAAASSTGGAIAVAPPSSDEITEEEFEQLLDALHGEGGAPGVREPTAGAGATSASPSQAAPSGGGEEEISEEEFEQLLDTLHGPHGAPGIRPRAAAPVGGEAARSAAAWTIRFRPSLALFERGTDPLRIFRELEALGRLQVTAELDALPGFERLDPTVCYLAWELHLESEASPERVREILAWLEGEGELEITPPPTAVAAPVAATSGEQREGNTEKRSEATEPTSRPVTSAPPVAAAGGEATSIRVAIDKIDALVNMVGELVITQSMLSRFAERFDPEDQPKLAAGLAQLERNMRELQEAVMRIRMLPIRFAFSRFPRLVHDLSAKLGKKVELRLTGGETELDKTVMERIGDPLVHLVRNALDHGIETPEVRRARGKPETGVLHLHAYHQSGHIVIEVRDDGAGLDREKILAKARARGLVKDEHGLSDDRIYEIIFQPGFSTAEQVSDVSGRGVGMDVVRRNIKALGGRVEVQSRPGEGTTITIRLPLTLAIVDGQTVRVGGETYIIPLVSIVETVRIRRQQVNVVAGRAEVVRLREQYLPLVRLYEVLGVEPQTRDLEQGLVVVVAGEGRQAGLFVDELLGQQQVVIKSLEANFMRVPGLAGATILGDGTVALILDVPELIALAQARLGASSSGAGEPARVAAAAGS